MQKTTLAMEETIEVCKLLGDRTRLTILALLEKGECCVCELVEVLEMSQPSISQHLRRLRDAKLVQEERRGQWVYYSVNRDIDHYSLVVRILEFVPEQTDLIEKMELARNC